MESISALEKTPCNGVLPYRYARLEESQLGLDENHSQKVQNITNASVQDCVTQLNAEKRMQAHSAYISVSEITTVILICQQHYRQILFKVGRCAV